MTGDTLYKYEFTPILEESRIRCRFLLRAKSQWVEFHVPADAFPMLIDAMRGTQERYTLAILQRNRKRAKPKLSLVNNDDDSSS